MGLHSGSMTLTRYRLIGCKNPTIAELNKELPRYQAKRIKLSGVRTGELASWTMPQTPETDDIEIDGHWDMSHAQFDNGFLLRMRVEKRNISSELASIVYRARLIDLEQEKQRPLGRKEKRELKEEIKTELLEKSLPNISYTDAFWNHEDHYIFLFSGSKKIQSLFEDLFKKTFADHLEAILIKVEPPLLGLSPQDWMGTVHDKSTLNHILSTTPITYSAINSQQLQ